MDNLLEYGNWCEHKIPFKHFRAESVLDENTYKEVEANFNAVKTEQVKKKNGDVYRLEKLSSNYDAQMVAMDNDLAELFQPFFSIDFLKSIAQLLEIPFNYAIDGALHSSPRNSRTGWIHTDFCNAWFDSRFIEKNQLSFPNRQTCDYFTGRRHDESADPRKFTRAATLIFYLCNDGWKKGDGGETGLYGAGHLSDNTVFDIVAPKNNSLILFECSPHSYHRFLTNRGRTRNSIILWIHSTPETSSLKWLNAVK